MHLFRPPRRGGGKCLWGIPTKHKLEILLIIIIVYILNLIKYYVSSSGDYSPKKLRNKRSFSIYSPNKLIRVYEN